VWLGYIPEQDLKYAYAAMDLLVYPSRYATESGALLTAMGYGRVILASKLPPFVEKEKVGALATYANVAELQQAIKVLIANEDQRASIKVKALAYCEKNSWEEVAKMHIKLYEEVLNNVGVDMATKAPTEDIRQS
jgi:glycosyltransferase involved in cell wall biosynthesis